VIDDVNELGVTVHASRRAIGPSAAQPAPPTLSPFGQRNATTLGVINFVGALASSWVFEAAKKLQALGKLRPGWDSHGGLPLKQESKDLTLQVLDQLGEEELPVPSVILGSGGHVSLAWRKKGRELDVELLGGNAIDYVKVSPDGEIEEGKDSASPGGALRGLAGWLLHG
jgi:hypothetical protein